MKSVLIVKFFRSLFFLFFFVSFSWGWINSLSEVQIDSGVRWEQSTAFYSPSDAPLSIPPGNGKAFIKIMLDVTKGAVNSTANFGVFIYHSDDKKYEMGCCANSSSSGCSQQDQIYLSNSPPTSLLNQLRRYYFENKTNSQKISWQFDITSSGVYYVDFLSCGNSLTVDGNIIFMNPYGHLRGNLFPFLPFYLSLSALYLLIAIVWFILSAIHWRQLLKLQNFFAGVIAMGMIESGFDYFTYFFSNYNGTYHIGIALSGIFVTISKKTVSRILVLMVSMGYGFVRPTLGTTQYKIFFLGTLYFIFSILLETIEMLQKHESLQITGALSFFILLPVAVMDTAFFWWIYISLIRTIGQLTARKQNLKLSLYKAFLGILVLALLFTICILVVGIIFAFTISTDNRWRIDWIITASWSFLYFLILFAMVIIFRPTENNTRYAYSQLLEDNEDELDTLPNAEPSTPHTTAPPSSPPSQVSNAGKSEDESKETQKKNELVLNMAFPNLAFENDVDETEIDEANKME